MTATTLHESPSLMSNAAQDALARMEYLDLSMVKMKLADDKEGVGWTTSHCEDVEREYRRYLALSWLYPAQPIVPSKVVDTFWHAHILDTLAYAGDCDRVFGHFLHHFPYFGMRNAKDALALGAAYDETLSLYELHFGDVPNLIWARSGAGRCPNCGRTCK